MDVECPVSARYSCTNVQPPEDQKIEAPARFNEEIKRGKTFYITCNLETGYPSWEVLDPKVASWLLNPDNPPITFSELLDKHLEGRYTMAAAIGRVSNEIHLSDLALLDPVMTDLSRKLQQEELCGLFTNIEVKLTPILSAMEVQGIKVSGGTLHEYGGILQVLFEELKLDQQCRGQKLARTNVQNLKSTSEAVLVKMKSTYIDGIVDYITRVPRLHPYELGTNYSFVWTITIRQSCTGHNATALRMREPFVSHDGWTFVAADFQSMELRLLAHLSKDQVLLDVFNPNSAGDIFVQLTCEWLGVSETKVSAAERDRTKRIVYSVIYGVGPERLAETLGVSKDDAKVFTKSFLGKYD
ncbi:DNA polymerase nu-like [Diadema antillarum]|uniref:DNA polymerase nu-like n=1 Tax=Diadema antillarum TaxID=105358 RepID=UPI003A854396